MRADFPRPGEDVTAGDKRGNLALRSETEGVASAVAAKFPVKAIKLADVADGVKKQNAQVPKNLCVMAGVVSFELTARGFGDRCSTS